MFMGFWQRARQHVGLCGAVLPNRRRFGWGFTPFIVVLRMRIAMSDGRTGGGFFIHSGKGLVIDRTPGILLPGIYSSDLVNSYLIYICIVTR